MTPVFPILDKSNHFWGDSKNGGNFCQSLSLTQHCLNLRNSRLVQFCISIFRTPSHTFWFIPSMVIFTTGDISRLRSIIHVVLWSASPQMPWVATRRIVARVKYIISGLKCSTMQNKRKSVCANSDSFHIEASISPIRPSSSPFPTIVNSPLIDFGPKVFNRLFGKVVEFINGVCEAFCSDLIHVNYDSSCRRFGSFILP